MNQDIIKGKWNEVKGSIQEKWGKLTDDDLAQIDGDRLKLAGKLQQAYGMTKDNVEKQLAEWEGQQMH